jgi:hypothetical protein
MATSRKVVSFEEFSEHPRELFERVLHGEEVIVRRGKGEAVALNLADATDGVELSPAQLAAFLSAAGGWADLDTETLKAQLRASRDMPPRPPVDL